MNLIMTVRCKSSGTPGDSIRYYLGLALVTSFSRSSQGKDKR